MATTESNAEKTLEQLCLEASRETDSAKLMALIEEIDRKFDDKHRRKTLLGPSRNEAA